jgi:hypothetical protein
MNDEVERESPDPDPHGRALTPRGHTDIAPAGLFTLTKA